MDVFSLPHFRNDEAARKFLEGILWPDGPICPKCGTINHAYATKKPGVFRCAESKCRKDFTVTMNTVMERSHIALHKWLQAFHLMTASKKGISAHQLHRSLDITYEAAWFMTHRIREAMRTGGLAPMGGGGKIVEADETYSTATFPMHIILNSKQGAVRSRKTRALGASAPSLPLWSVAAVCARSMCPSPTKLW
jgi:transposase-like protein